MNGKEMTAREYAYQRARICKGRSCWECPLFDAAQGNNFKRGCTDLQLAYPDEAVRIVAEWAEAHPEETLEPLGDNIYYDPKHRIVPDEITRVFTVEVTCVDKGGRAWGEKIMKDWREIVAPQWLKGEFPSADDVKCVKVQQFITKCHEEGI